MRRIRSSVVAIGIVALALVAFPAGPASASPGVPSAPKSVKPLPGNGRAKVTWVAPFSDGGHKVTAYKVTTYHNEVALAVNVFRSTATAQTIVGLTNGQAYTFTVSAKNVTGWSRFSARSPAVKVGIPAAPARASVVPAVGKATVSWHAPDNHGSAIDSYRVTPYLAGAGQPPRSFKASPQHQVVTGLQHGKRYQFKVAAHNKFGWSDPSPVSKTVVVK